MGQFQGADLEFELTIRYRYYLSKKKAISYENLPIFGQARPKKSVAMAISLGTFD